jgi:glycogen debranching enzyme
LTSRSETIREIPTSPTEIIRATDLGGVRVLKRGDIYLLADELGDVYPDSRGLGLYSSDTRVVSYLAVRINGGRPVLLGADKGYRGTIQMTNADSVHRPDRGAPDATLAPARESLGISRERVLYGGLHERLRVANYAQCSVPVTIELLMDVDDADIFEVRGYVRPSRGIHFPILVRDDGRMTFRYEGLDGRTRWTYLEATSPNAISAATVAGDGAAIVRWERDIAAGVDISVDWRIWTALTPSLGSSPTRADRQSFGGTGPGDPTGAEPFPPCPTIDPATGEADYRAWSKGFARIASDNELLDLVIQRSLADLRLLTTDGPNPGERYVAAGVPWYTTLFGRDAIITGLQTLAFRPEIAIEALEVLAARQADTVDDWRDAEPGKILHELRTGEMARAGELPYSPYYGTVDATPLWLVLLGATYDWTGDRGLVDRLWPHALAALRWIDDYGTGADGFVTYERRSPEGQVNQGWKDSEDSVRDRTGATTEPPIALAEVQGYVYDAKLRMAGLADMRGETELATRLRREAADLRASFEAAFWLPDLQFYAMAIGRDGHAADAVGSNVGHCLWSGVVGVDRAAAVMARLTAPDLDSGWGIRTYASRQPGYNPISYHLGSVWPHDNALVIAGLKRYGFDEAANQLAGSIFEAAQRFDGFRLPELFCGFARTDIDAPVPYPVACSPQAWAAGAPLHILSSMLGFRANAARGELELLRPHLPAWLSKVAIDNLRVGGASVDLLFRRRHGTTSAEVVRKSGDLAITIHQ